MSVLICIWHKCVCVCVPGCSSMCICMCGTVDQNRALTVAGLLLADACLEELTAARSVNHWACPLALYSHHPFLLTLNLAGRCFHTLCVLLYVCVSVSPCVFGDGRLLHPFSVMCVWNGSDACVCFKTEIKHKAKLSKTGANIAEKLLLSNNVRAGENF